MLYAIGEIVLVVVGILIAVSIGNWNEQRKAKEQSYIYLQRLNEDVEFILKDVYHSITGTEKRLNNSIITKEALYAKQLSMAKQKSFDKYLGQYYQFYITIKDSNTYNEMLSAGDLNLIENSWIRDRFAELAASRDFIIEVNQTFHEKAIKDADKFEKYVRYDLKNPGTDSAKTSPRYNFEAMAADTTFANLISKQSVSWSDILRMFRQHYSETQQLGDSIQSELKKSTY